MQPEMSAFPRQMAKLVGYVTLCLAALALPQRVSADKQAFKTWRLDVQFVNASKAKSDAEIKAAIEVWVAHAERVYKRPPALDIRPTTIKLTKKDGRDLSNLVFDSHAEYANYMDRNFDNVAVTKTEGHFVVLITDSLCIGKTPAGKPDCAVAGIAHFPHSVNPFSRKRGITLEAGSSDFILSHELGHVFGLKHTFEPYIGFKPQCNQDYKPKGNPEGRCNSCANGKIVYSPTDFPKCNGPINIMDYCGSLLGDEFFNPCQEQRAADQRYVYMTDDGKTNYWKLKGLVGEAICDEDSDCDEGRYCDKGTLTVGRNQCLPLKNLGVACTRGGECKSDRCNLLKCSSADECNVDSDCAGDAYCNLGVATVGQNTCEARLSDGRMCTGDHQCRSQHCSEFRPQDGQLTGLCYTPDSQNIGESCNIDLECRQGKCNSNKRCACKDDADCGSGYWCDGGFDAHENSCKRKLDSGEVCGTVGELSVGHRCKSGDCKVSGLSTKLKCK